MNNYLIELSLIHMVLILGYWFFLRGERQFAKLRFFLLGSTVLALVIPLLKLPGLFSNQKSVVALPIGDISVETIAVTAQLETSYWYEDLIAWVYLFGCLFFLLKFIGSLIHLISLILRSKCKRVGSVNICKLEKGQGSFSFFNWVFINDETAVETGFDAILKHEIAHVSYGHTYDLIFIELFKICFWWLPSSWFLQREIRKIHEYQADAHALKSYSIDQYSSILIQSTLKSHGLALASSFHNGLIIKRLKTMKENVKNVSPWKIGTLSILVIVLFVVFACTEETRSDVTIGMTGETFTLVEEQPEFVGGMDGFYRFVAGEVMYPREARVNGVEGKVYVQFVVEKDGSLSSVEAVKGIGFGCDEEAVRVIKKSPAFNPGKQRGKPVRVRMVMPISFQINNDKFNADNSPQGIIIVDNVESKNGQLKVDAKYSNGVWSGIVYSPEGDVLPGANIVVTGTTTGTVSDLDGSFEVKADKVHDLNISFVGYESVRMVHNR